MKTSKVSIVIPVYNEEEHLGACLQAIAAQTVRPREVIVVDNNSTDNTAAIARQFPFVRVLTEYRQGVVHARGRGFDAARGEVIGRIDADSLVSEDWVEMVQHLFTDPKLDAVSGAVSYYDFPNQRFNGALDLYFRRRIARGMGDEVFLYGANMAMRRAVWRSVRADVCLEAGLHEDFDLAIHAHQAHAVVRFDERLRASVSLRRFDTSFKEFWPYAWLNPRTYAKHGLRSQWHMYPVISLVLACYLPLKLLHRGYDADLGDFGWQQALTPKAVSRVNPATFVE